MDVYDKIFLLLFRVMIWGMGGFMAFLFILMLLSPYTSQRDKQIEICKSVKVDQLKVECLKEIK